MTVNLVRRFLHRLRGIGIHSAAKRILGLELSPHAVVGHDLRVLLGSASVIVDVGAYTGDTAQEYLALFPSAHVYAIEPASANFAELSNLNNPQIHPFRSALGQTTGEVELNLLGSSASNSVLTPNKTGDRVFPKELRRVTTEIVPSSRLDDFCVSQSLDAIDLLKIDTQGSELAVLGGGHDALGMTRAVLVEVNFLPQYVGSATYGEVEAALRELGFELYNLYNLYRDWATQRVVFCDALFVDPAKVNLNS